MDKVKLSKNQKRQDRHARKAQKRKKKVLCAKHTGQPKKLVKKVINNKVFLKAKIRFFIQRIFFAIQRLGCVIGIHDWKLCSGREGDPMYACMRCWAKSKTKWEKGGSAEYYDEKHKDKMEIANPKNWEKIKEEFYFKGEYVKMTVEEKRRLEVILKIKK